MSRELPTPELQRVDRLRFALVTAQLATIASTWPLWESARETPLLPLVAPLSTIPFGVLLALSAVGVLHGSRRAMGIHALVLALAALGDAHRLQPAPISIAMLLAILAGERTVDQCGSAGAHGPRTGVLVESTDGSGPRARAVDQCGSAGAHGPRTGVLVESTDGSGPRARAVDRRLVSAHLAAVWIASGVGKLASDVFATEIASRFTSGLASHLPDGSLSLAPAIEIALGIAILTPRARPIAAVLGALFHVVVLACLVSIDWNRGVWAWNVALAITGLSLASTGIAARDASTPPRTLAAAALLAYPLLHPLGLAPPSTAFFVYGGLEPVTLVCDRENVCTLDREVARSIDELEAPLPGSLALLRASFEASCAPGERWLARERAGDETLLAETTCPRETR